MGTPPTGGGRAMGTHFRTEILSRETFHAGAGKKETGLVTTRRSTSAEGCRCGW